MDGGGEWCDSSKAHQSSRFVKDALSLCALQSYVPMIVEETVNYFGRWADAGQECAAKALAELTIMTASRCLMGKEIRAQLDEKGMVWCGVGWFAVMLTM